MTRRLFQSIRLGGLAALFSLGLSCAHRTEGKLVTATNEYTDSAGKVERVYERDVNRDGYLDREIEVYDAKQELVEYKLDLDQDGVLEKHWTKENEFRSDEFLSEEVKKTPDEERVSEEGRREEGEGIDYSRMSYLQAIAFVHTPKEVQAYFKQHWEFSQQEIANSYARNGAFPFSLSGESSDPPEVETFKHNHLRRKGLCLDYALAAAALLSDDGYPPLILFMRQALPPGASISEMKHHAVFLYRTEQGFDALGNTPRKAKYATLPDVVKSFRTFDVTFNAYAVINLEDNHPGQEWIHGDLDFQYYEVDEWQRVEYGKKKKE